MYKIVRRENLNNNTVLLEFYARDIALVSSAGQFLIIRTDEFGERFPLTIHDTNKEKGTITVVFQKMGVSTNKLANLNVDESILDVLGPLGHPVSIVSVGHVLLVGGGIGIAEIYPVAKYLKEVGNEISVLLGARNKDLLICEKKIRELTDKVYIATDDGSCGLKGNVCDVLNDLLNKEAYDLVFAVGPIVMMKLVSKISLEKKIKTIVSLNSIMVDGTGMCGSCRITYNGKTKFTCVDGPDFDASLVDFDELIKRQNRFKDEEVRALENYKHKCKLGI